MVKIKQSFFVRILMFTIVCWSSSSTLALNPIGSWGTSTTYGVTVKDNYAFCAARYGGLNIFDVTNPSSPVLVSHLDLIIDANDVIIEGNLAFITDLRSSGSLAVVDISDINNPQLMTTISTGRYALHCDVKDNLLFVANSDRGLNIYDISDIYHPELLGSYKKESLVWVEYVEVIGNYAYMLDGRNSSLWVIDITDPSNPSLLSSVNTSGWCEAFQIQNNYIYIADGEAGLQIININDPLAPVLENSIATTGYAWDISVNNGYAYIAEGDDNSDNFFGNHGLSVVNVNDVNNIFIEDKFDIKGSCQGISIYGDNAYLASMTSGLQVINIADPTSLFQTGEYYLDGSEGDAYKSIVIDNTLFLAAGEAGLKILDVTNPEEIELIGECLLPGESYCIEVNGSTVYVGGSLGIYLVDITHPELPQLISHVASPDSVYDLHHSGTTLYTAEDYGGVGIYDITNTSSPHRLYAYDTEGRVFNIFLDGSVIYAADYNKGLTVIEFSNPTGPSIISTTYNVGGGYVMDVVVHEGYAYVAANYNNLKVYDVSDPGNITLVESMAYSGWVRNMTFSDGYLYLSKQTSGFQIVNVSDPENVLQAGGNDTDMYNYYVTSYGSYTYVSNYRYGVLEIFNSSELFNSISSQERQSLIDLYNSTNGDQWGNNSGWKDGPLETDGFAMHGTESSWFGVYVDSSNSNVNYLILSNNSLTGTIPQLDFPELITFYINDNNINNIESLDGLDSLKYLYCYNNQLTELPEINRVPNLSILNCSNNQLTQLPELNGLISLTELNCDNNQLTALPDISELIELDNLRCNYNQLTVLPSLNTLKNLQILSVTNNMLTQVPDIISLTDLEWLYFGNNQLTEFPEVSGLRNLKFLECYQNQLSQLPELTGLDNLQYFRCQENNLTCLPDVSELKNLKVIDCHDNQLTQLPDLSGLSNLTELLCYSNQLLSLPDLTDLSSLESLYCYNNQLTELPDLSGLVRLDTLNCRENYLSSIPDISGLNYLRFLYINNNYLNYDDCTDIAALQSIPVPYFLFNNQADGFTIDCNNAPNWVITATSGENGSISSQGDVDVYANSSQLYYFTPEPEYQLSEILVDGAPVDLADVYIFENITADHTIHVTFERVPDTEAPEAPTNFRGFFENTSDIKLYWTASLDNQGIRYYAIYRGEDNSLVGTTSDTSYLVNNVSQDTMHRFKIKAFDFGGNTSPFAPEAVVMPESYDTQDPTAPENCVGAGISDTAVRLAWDASTDDIGVRYYAIYRSEDYSLVGTTPYTSYVIRDLEQYVTYKYKIKAFDYADNRSGFGNEVQVRTLVPDDEAPTVPQNLVAMGSSSSEVILRWNSSTDNEGVRFYAIYRYEDSVLLGTSYTNEFILGGLSENTDYSFRIKAFDFNSNRSAFSNTATTQTLKPDTSAPTPPSNLAGEAVSPNQIQLKWDPSTDDQGVRMYAIYMGASNTLAGTTWQTEFLVNGLSGGTDYTFKLKAFDWNGNRSGFSNEITVSTPAASGAAAPYGGDPQDIREDNKLEYPHMVYIPGGHISITSNEQQSVNTLEIKPFYLSQYEVTVEEFAEFLNSVPLVDTTWFSDSSDSPESHIINDNGYYLFETDYADYPVVDVTWYGAEAYCRWLTETYSGEFYLPSEMEWEYACRAGSDTPFNTGNTLHPEEANFADSMIDQPVAVGSYLDNTFGVFDMHGNVWEWCANTDMTCSNSENSNITAPIRGGSWSSSELSCASSFRYEFKSTSGNTNIGFRIARTF